MIAPEPSRNIVKRLKAAGFTSRPGKGSHEEFTCSHGRCPVAVPTGHRTISPGVVRQVNKAIEKCATECG
ncbi:type II toxin-antitoxin system HicA family toxin [Gordonia sp. SND2]|uniref:type II toxin-antitoxin system HicA family toxin n=1 Tax=Gordonia sp. SND2 TaxID=3388659 RepID=UPI00398BB01D